MEKKINSQFILGALAICAFAIGSTEFISVGLLPLISKDMGTTISLTSLTVSLYAIGVTIGAPLLTVLTKKLNRKTLMLLIMLVFIIGNLTVAIAPTFTIIIVGRVISAMAHGIFMSVSSLVAADVVQPEKRASAIVIMFTGLTVATVTGVPLGTYIGQTTNWRMSFVFIAVIGIIGFISNWLLLPNNLSLAEDVRFKSIPKVLFNKSMLPIFLTTALGYGGTFVFYTYVSAVLVDNMGFTSQQVVWILIAYGIMVAVGNSIGGTYSNKNTLTSLTYMFALLAATLIGLYFVFNSHLLGVIGVLLLGLFAFMNVPGLQLIVMDTAQKVLPREVSMASALNISAFNVGIALGSGMGAKVVDTIGIQFTPLFGALMIVLALGLTLFMKKNNDLS